ncbi:MAG: hypothetical protein IT438_16915 [Phycisphaerales bacterium]|nr:hypothetical protein [Phycisphaerales bacterium]
MCSEDIPNETIVLKFGGSALTHVGELRAAVGEIRREVRKGRSVIAIVSPIFGTTPRLLAEAGKLAAADPPSGPALARLVAGGARHAASLLSVALWDAGQAHTSATAREVGLLAQGPSGDAEPAAIDTAAVQHLLNRAPVLVLPGLESINEREQPTLLGGGGPSRRGGTDLLAVFIAEALGADVRLIKDSEGVYDTPSGRIDPRADERARRYRTIAWEDASRLAGRIVGPRALALAARRGVRIQIGALGASRVTTICWWTELEHPTSLEIDLQPGVTGARVLVA